MLPRPDRLGPAVVLAAASSLVLTTLALGPGAQAAPDVPGPASTPSRATDPAADVLRHAVELDGREVRLDLERVEVRTADYRVRLQNPDGSFTDQQVAPSQAYLGTVRGDSSATAAAVVGHDGVVRGLVVSDRGECWLFEGDQASTAPTEDPGTYRWPAASDPSLNRTVAPGQVGPRTRQFDIGVDLDNSVFTTDLGGSVDAAVDLVDRLVVQMMIAYEGGARLRPAVTRLVVRGSADQDPYRGLGDDDKLNRVQTEWDATQADVERDDLLLMHSVGQYGGLAYTNVAGTPQGRALAGYFYGVYNAYPITRHEIGHTWGPGDMHTAAPDQPGPEGPTIMSGNSLDRFDGTEMSAILRHRDSQQRRTGPFDAVPTSTHSFAPYAALDLVDDVRGRQAVRVSPLANDSDANGDGLSLARVDRRSHLGGTVRITRGRVRYVAPAAAARRTVDWFTYRVRDSDGRTATGVVLLRIDGRRTSGAAGSTPHVRGTAGSSRQADPAPR